MASSQLRRDCDRHDYVAACGMATHTKNVSAGLILQWIIKNDSNTRMLCPGDPSEQKIKHRETAMLELAGWPECTSVLARVASLFNLIYELYLSRRHIGFS